MLRFIILPAALCLFMVGPLCAGEKTVKVFILAGQSNMEGKAPNALLERQAKDPKTKELFSHLRKDDKWIVRDDVFVKFLDRHGPLTIGFGSPGRTGIELEFGTLMGNHFEEPVILVKTAWGGHSLFKNFRSPTAGYPAAEVLQKELEQMQANVKKSNEKNKKDSPLPTMEDVKSQYGASYRKMMAEVKDVMDNYATLFPALKGHKKLEVAGFVWFQGWNDQYGAQEEYASNLKHFINDVRKDLRAPKLPFVIGVMGQNGSKPGAGAMLTIQKAQLSMNDLPEFKGNVKAIRTDVLVDKAAEELYPTWRQNAEQWKLVGGDFPYHYLGSAIWFNRIGKAMGEAMLELLKNQQQTQAGDQAKITHSFLATGGATYIVNGDGKVTWEYPHGSRDGWVLPNGNILLALSKSKKYPGGGAVEVTRDNKVTFEFKGTQSEVNTVQAVEKDQYLITEAGAKPRLLEVNREGKIVVDIPLKAQTKDHHLQTRMARKLANGNYLVPQLLDKVVREYSPKGDVVWEVKTPNMPFTAIRLDNGNTLIGCTLGNLVIEVNKDGKTVWQVTNDDLPGRPINDACGVQRLPNGNTVITSHHATKDDVKLTEVTPDKKVVWTHRDSMKPGIHHFQILDVDGKAVEGRPLR